MRNLVGPHGVTHDCVSSEKDGREDASMSGVFITSAVPG